MNSKKTLTKKQIELNIANVKATLAMEGLNLTDDELEVLRRYAQGELTQKQVFEIFNV